MRRLFADADAALLELALTEVAAACRDLSRPAAPTQRGGLGAAVWPHGSRSSTGEGGSGDGVASPALAVAGSACLPGPRCGAGEDGSSVATTAARPSTAAPTRWGPAGSSKAKQTAKFGARSAMAGRLVLALPVLLLLLLVGESLLPCRP